MQWCDFMYFDMVLDSSSLGYMFLKELNGFRVLYCPLQAYLLGVKMRKRMGWKTPQAQYNLKGNEAVQRETGFPENKLGKQSYYASEILFISKGTNFLQGVISQMVSSWSLTLECSPGSRV